MRRNEPFESGQKGDALISDDPERVIAIRIADCVPVLLSSDDGTLVAAVHSGWRGVVANVVGATVHHMLMIDPALTPPRLRAAIGPCIGFDAFEVGPEVVEAFARSVGTDAPVRLLPDGKGRVDLRGAVRLQLLRAGLGDGSIDTTDRCTHRDGDEFFSHRRERGLTGRMAALISPGGAR